MPTLEEGLAASLKRHEGWAPRAYRCPAGYLTIGWGRNLEQRGITKAEGDHLLAGDVRQAIADARAVYPGFDDLATARQSVLAEMAFNLGKAGLRCFRMMLAAVAAGDFKTAALEMTNSRWSNQVGQRAARLANTMLTGEFLD